MIQIHLDQKPLSVNEAWLGSRSKSAKYRAFEKAVLLQMPAKKINPELLLRVELFFGFSSMLSDIDNPVKMILDICQRKYSFNDRNIFELNIRKCKVEKGKEFIDIGIYNLLPFE